MKNWLSILAILAFVSATAMAPFVSRAIPHHSAKIEQAQISEKHDCHKQNAVKEISEKAAQDNKESSDTCCGKGVCKCVNGSCHGGIATISGNGGNYLFVIAASENRLDFVHQLSDSALPERLKRPPRA